MSVDFKTGLRFKANQFRLAQAKSWFKITGIGGHLPHYAELMNCMGDNQFNFTLLRDPGTRTISFYNYLSSEHGIDLPFDHFLKQEEYTNFQTKALAGKEDLELAKQRLNQFDFVGIFEELDRTYEILGLELGLHSDLKQRNQSSGIRAQELTQAQQDRLDEINQLDNSLYNYALQKFKGYKPSSTAAKALRLWPWNRLFSRLQSYWLKRKIRS